jgi:signal transduction histidine kinase
VRLSTVRVRLTALFAGLFLVVTTALLVTVNILLKQSLDHQTEGFLGRHVIESAPGGTPITPSPGTGAPQSYSLKAIQDLGASVLAYQWTVTWVAVGLLAVVGTVLGWWLVGRVLRPVHHIAATARRLSLSNLHERIALTGPRDELRDLADTFDAMLERLERAADRQRRFAANASHELRTPLAIQRAAIEIGLDDPSPDQLVRIRRELLRANERTEKLIDGLLTLAQGEHGSEQHTTVDLGDLVQHVVEEHAKIAAAAGVLLEVEPVPVTVTGDPVLLTRIVANLVQNAIRHNHPGGHVHIRTSPDGGLTVVNTGPTVLPESVPHLFEPFRRLHPPRTGTAQGAGLGLSIVAAIAETHHAHLAACANPQGGLTITITLPTPRPDVAT